MNLDTSIYRMAFREADSLGVAQVLVAKKRADLEHQMLLKQINAPHRPAPTSNAPSATCSSAPTNSSAASSTSRPERSGGNALDL